MFSGVGVCLCPLGSPTLVHGGLTAYRDGRLCVLDWGMTLQVPKDLQYGLLEFIAHINSEDYDAIPNDFVNLGTLAIGMD